MFSESDFIEMEPYLLQDEEAFQSARAKTISTLNLQISALEDRERRLTDAYIDQAINRSAYDERRSTLLMELAVVRDDLRHAEDDTGGGLLRVKQFFEPLKALSIGPEIDNRVAFREAIEKLTSNRTLARKDLSFALRSPFQEILGDMNLLLCEPSRDVFRTCTSHSTPTENSAAVVDDTLPEKRARILLKYLENWKPPPSFTIEDTKPERRPQPHWFKRKEPPQTGQHG